MYVTGRVRWTLFGAVLLWHIAALVRWRLLLQTARDEARRDPLTGLGNRRAFQEALQHCGQAVTLLGIMDLDGFKAVNDRYGHHAGDQILCTLAERMQVIASDRDISAYRLGGDELAVIWWRRRSAPLPTPQTEGDLLIEDVLGASFQVDGHLLRVGASIGVVVCTRTSEAEELLRSADAALYAAKRNRRRVRHDVSDRSGPNGGRRLASHDARSPHAVARMIGDDQRQRSERLGHPGGALPGGPDRHGR